MDARAEYVIRIPVAELHPQRRSRRGARPAPVAHALRSVLAVLSSEPPLAPPGRFVIYALVDGVYHHFRIEVPDLRDGRAARTRALPDVAPPAGAHADAEDSAARQWERDDRGGMRRIADGLWEITPYAPDAEGW